MPAKQPKKRPRPSAGRGLLPEDHSPIKLVPAKDREWWDQLGQPAQARFAERMGKKWTDEETLRLIEADPESDDYYELGAEMGRAPGALRIRRSHMIHLLRDEYGHLAKAEAYAADPKDNHRLADIAHVHRLLKAGGYYDLPIKEQFRLARHLKQPTDGWRGDRSGQVLRQRREAMNDLKRAVRKPSRPGSK